MPPGILDRLRGCDKWPFTTATVTATEQVGEGGRTGLTRKIYFKYSSGTAIQEGKFFVDSNSSIYELANGDEFDIQVDPLHPSRYYSSEASSLSRTIRRIIMFVGATILFIVYGSAILGWLRK
jgi:hypothetical protein